MIGCGNLHYDEWLRVPLSSIDQRSHLIGQRAGEILLAMVEGQEWTAPENVILEPALVIRASTAVAKTAKTPAKAGKKASV